MKRILIIVVLVQLTACMSFSDRSFRSTKHSLEDQLPQMRLEKEFAVSIGNGFLNFLNVITLDGADISDLDNVDVAVYNVEMGGQDIDFDEVDFTETLRSRGEDLHWETIVKVREESEQVWVLVGLNLARDSLDAISVFVLENDELVLISVDGDLNRMIEFALQPASEHRHHRHRDHRDDHHRDRDRDSERKAG